MSESTAGRRVQAFLDLHVVQYGDEIANVTEYPRRGRSQVVARLLVSDLRTLLALAYTEKQP